MKINKLLLGGLFICSTAFGSTKTSQLSILPGVQLGATKEDSISSFSFNILGAENKNVSGFDLSLIGYRKINGDFNGWHLNVFPDIFMVDGDVNGFTWSTWNNVKGNLYGASVGVVNKIGQDSGFNLGLVNYVQGQSGAQIGLFNYSESVKFFQLGLVNGTKNINGVQIGLINYAADGLVPVLPLLNFRYSF
ncbi:LA_2272 family surface repeat-containing protein [Fusobacterium sp. IOR10]|uniref:LA_2272 family surface repeat-containing protein n=1 Tax=Fusobacterium sp. IOR10 TaxID=2665157 RepID=UPI0013D2416C|nr:hypothetical protein [Fusobacterium sp. IOR10]